MVVINLIGPPGVGKSVIALDLASRLKKSSKVVEYVSEYAKDLVWAKRNVALSDQLYILGKQNHRLHVIKDAVDVVVTDCPLISAAIYNSDNTTDSFKDVVVETFRQHDRINIYIDRNLKYGYEQEGRNETLEESDAIGVKYTNFLDLINEDYYRFTNNDEIVDKIIGVLNGK